MASTASAIQGASAASPPTRRSTGPVTLGEEAVQAGGLLGGDLQQREWPDPAETALELRDELGVGITAALDAAQICRHLLAVTAERR